MKKKYFLLSFIITILSAISLAQQPVYDIHIMGWGPVKIGMSKGEVEAISGYKLNPFFSDPEYPCKTYTLDKSDLKIEFMFSKNNNNYTLSRIYVSDSRIKTSSNTGIGSSKSDIIKAYYNKIEIKTHTYSDCEILVYIPIDKKESLYRIAFETDDKGIVREYSVGKLPEIFFIEGCL